MVAVVTGAAGHVGVNLVDALLADGREVRIVERREAPGTLPSGLTWVQADVRDQAAMRRAIEGAEVVFHLAAVISVAGSMSGLVPSVNIGGVSATARAALAVGVPRFVHCSSVHAFDLMACRGSTVDEHSPRALDPALPPYDRSKAAGERALRAVVEDGLDAVILNPTGIIGPRDEAPSRMGAVLRAAALGHLPATVQGSFDWVDVRDVVAALLAAETSGAVGENHLVGGRSASVAELARLAADAAGARRPVADLPLWFARLWSPGATALARRSHNPLLYTTDSLHALDSRPQVDHSKATSILGHRPRPLQDSVADFVRSLAMGDGAEPSSAGSVTVSGEALGPSRMP